MVPLLPRLVFLVVGPAVDVKLFAMRSGIFGRGFAIRFAPATFVVATVIATGVGGLILGSGSRAAKPRTPFCCWSESPPR